MYERKYTYKAVGKSITFFTDFQRKNILQIIYSYYLKKKNKKMSNENKKPTMMTRIMNKIRNFFFKKKKISKIIEVNHPPSNRIITMGYCSNIERCPTIRKIHRLCPGDCGKLCCYFCDKCDQCH